MMLIIDWLNNDHCIKSGLKKDGISQVKSLNAIILCDE